MMTWRLPAPRPNEGGQGGACFPCIFALVGQGADSAAMGAHGRGRRGGRSAIEPGACAIRPAQLAGRPLPFPPGQSGPRFQDGAGWVSVWGLGS